MPLNLHLLRIFAAVAESNSFSHAAKTLYISQPAVSKGVRELEEQLGLPLIDRSRRKLALTDAGTLLYSHAQRLFAVEQAAETALEQLQGLERGSLALGASHTVGTYLLPPLLSRFRQLHPGIRLSMQIANSQAVLAGVHTRPLDVAFVEGSVKDRDLLATGWRTDHLVVIVPPRHRLISRQPVTLEQLAAEPYVQREQGSGTREIVEATFRQRGLALNVAIELGSNQVVKQTVGAGMGISIVSDATIELELAAGTLAVVELKDVQISRTISQVVAKGKPLSAAAAAFLQLIDEHRG